MRFPYRPAHLSSPTVFTYKRKKKAKTSGVFVHDISKKGARPEHPRAGRGFQISLFMARGKARGFYIQVCRVSTVRGSPDEGQCRLILAGGYIHLYVIYREGWGAKLGLGSFTEQELRDVPSVGFTFYEIFPVSPS